jgi:hypothetical protein
LLSQGARQKRNDKLRKSMPNTDRNLGNIRIKKNNSISDNMSVLSQFGKLRVEMFKIPDYQMSKEMKSLMLELNRKYSKIDDTFLNLFEKR